MNGNRVFVKLFAMVLMAAAMILFTGCATKTEEPGKAAQPAAKNTEPYILGVSVPLTGAFADVASYHVAGFNTYVHKVNQQGGVNGHPLKVEILDSRNDVATGISNAKALAEKKALAIFGNTGSNIWAAAAPIAAETKVASFGAAGIDAFFLPVQPYMFQTNLLAVNTANLQTGYITSDSKKKNLAKPKVALLRYDSTASATWMKEVQKLIDKNGWETVESQAFPMSATDVTPAAAAVAAKNPDYVLTTITDAQTPMVVNGLRARGYKGPVINWVSTSDATLERLKDPNMLIARVWVPAESVAWLRAEAEAAGTIKGFSSDYFTSGYGVAMVAAEAVKRCGWPCDGEKYKNALESIDKFDTKGLTGPSVGLSAKSHVLPDYGSLWHWDTAKGAQVLASEWISLE